MSDPKLPTDQYYILNDETFAGRNYIEDKSLGPKKVACPTDSNDPDLWTIEQLPNGRYRIKARGAPTGVVRGLLFAFLADIDKAEEWIITLRKVVDDKHRRLYTIQKGNNSGGWIKQEGGNPQIAVRPLIIGPSVPPFFPPNELWNIQPLVD